MKTRPGSLALAAVIVASLNASPQSQEPGPAFEVASVKPASPGRVNLQANPGRITIANQTAEAIIKIAYGLRDYQYVGPAWLHTTRYDIVATTGSPQPRSTELAMLRGLLAERFQLKVHHEQKSMPVYALIVGKNGPKLKPIDEQQPVPFEIYSNFSMAPIAGGATELRGQSSLGQLSDFLTRVVARPVVDRTGISGTFDIRLLCAVEGFPGFETSPSVFDAVQSQLGLKLEARITQVDVTVVDHVEKPGGN